MPYKTGDFKETNINYLNKDFESFKNSLIEYAKTYFPNTYKDFNESSPGMMLIEMSSYVGDVLSFYIDQQYREMLLPLAQEKRNVINIAKMLGYKVKPTTAAYVNITIQQAIGVEDEETTERAPDYGSLVTIDKGFKITSAASSDIIFETLGIVDFKASGSFNGETSPPAQTDFDDDGLVTEWTFTRTVRAISGETKTKSFITGVPTKFLELIIDDTEVTEIISVADSNNNKWYEVDFLAHDNVPIEKHYTEEGRGSDSQDDEDGNYQSTDGTATSIPFSLSFINTSKRFITKTNDDNTTSLVFGNGIIRTGTTLNQNFIDSEQAGITIPGYSENLLGAIDPLSGDEYSTLGEAPAHTTLTVKYRTGGGMIYNVQSGDLNSADTVPYIGTPTTATLTVTNNEPARGGSVQQSADEIRERAMGFFAAQNRCVTKEDYEARVLAMPARFGNIAKVYARRYGGFTAAVVGEAVITKLKDLIEGVYNGEEDLTSLKDLNGDEVADDADKSLALQIINNGGLTTAPNMPAIEIYTLSYDNSKNLVQLDNDNLIYINLKNYLSNFRILTDEILLTPGYIVNFGVFFDVVSLLHANKQEVKLRCIQKVKDYFDISKMQFKQPLYVSQLEYDLMSVDGVRGVNYVTITQSSNYNIEGSTENLFDGGALFRYSYNPVDGTWLDANDAGTDNGGQVGYGYKYNFTDPSVHENGMIRPPATPTVFELKNPNQNIKGLVR